MSTNRILPANGLLKGLKIASFAIPAAYVASARNTGVCGASAEIPAGMSALIFIRASSAFAAQLRPRGRPESHSDEALYRQVEFAADIRKLGERKYFFDSRAAREQGVELERGVGPLLFARGGRDAEGGARDIPAYFRRGGDGVRAVVSAAGNRDYARGIADVELP